MPHRWRERVLALWRLPPGRMRRELALFVHIAAPSVVIQMAQFMIVRVYCIVLRCVVVRALLLRVPLHTAHAPC